jgi:signal transduction histidine kinase
MSVKKVNIQETHHLLQDFSKTSMAINESETEEEITWLLENAVRKLVRNALLIISLYHDDTDTMRIVRYFGFPLQKLTKAFQKFFGLNPYQMEVKISDMDTKDLDLFTSGKLEKLDDLETFTGHTIPKPICRTLEKLFSIKAIYSIGFVRNKKYEGAQTGDFGGLTIFLKKQESIEYPEMIEAIVQQVSVAIQRRRAEIALLKSQEEIINLNKDLEQKVLDRTCELENSNIALEAFSHSVSHDLRAPLRAINGFSQILAQKYQDKMGSEASHMVQMVVDNTNRMSELINGLLKISKVSSTEIKKSKIDMVDLVRSIIAEIVSPTDRDKIILTVDSLSEGFGDPILIRQVWINLIENAVKFSRNKERPTIQISSYIENNQTIYVIKDNGAGFKNEYKNKLFTIFQRLHSTAEFEGTGVGLALTHRIIQKHSGKVWADGTEGQGATFYFSLPIKI